MRLHRLHLRAFGPFAGDQTVDFDQLAAGGLFLLDGPTGAGKSTVLDAITFALYGPGEQNGHDRLHSHFAATGVEPQVVLDLSVRGVRHRITRSPEFDRPKLRGTGVTRQCARVHLERWAPAASGGRWVSRSSNKAEVGELLADELGLTREQFTQVVVLPQGEFMRFLRADDDERRALLTRLFGTQLYDRITDEFERRGRDVGREIDAATAQLHAALAALGEAAGLDADARHALLAAADHDRERAVRDLTEQAMRAAAAARRRLARARVRADRGRVELERAAAARDRLAEWVRVRTALADHQATEADHQRRCEQLARARRAESVRGLVGALDAAARESARALACVTTQPDRAVSETDAPFDPITDEEPAVRLDDPGAAEPSELRRAAKALRGRVERARAAVLDLDAAAGVERELAERHASVRKLLADAATIREQLVAVETRRAALPAQLAELRDAVAQAATAAAELPGLDRELGCARERRDAALRRDELARQRGTLACAVRSAVDEHQQAVDAHQHLIDARWQSMAAELARSLRTGEPCTVCGSREHPAPLAGDRSVIGATQVSAAQQRRTDAERARREAERALADVDVALQRETAVAEGLPAATAAAQLADLEARATATMRRAAKLADLTAQRDEADAAAAALEKERDRLAAELAESTFAHRSAAEALEQIEQRVLAARAGRPSVAARQTQLRAVADWHNERADALTALAETLTALRETSRRANEQARAGGFIDAAEAASAMLAPDGIDRLDREVAAWRTRADHLAGQLEPARTALRAVAPDCDLDSGDGWSSALTAAETREAYAAAEAEDAGRAFDAAAEDKACAERAVGRVKAAAEDARCARAMLATVTERGEPVQHLARLTRGVAGHRRVALTTYVLRQWFEHVVAAANVRLAGMSSGRYELVRVDEARNRTERVGLTLKILDRHTGELRSPRSLSGGETFYTSLALALGLADVVKAEAGGIDLDTLFIDEGFGSLDADTLDSVMDVIDGLRERGRTVGIVSHVAELKERIGERIEVRRLADGSSTLRVVA